LYIFIIYMILINSTSTTFGPPGQWIYVNGEGFVIDGTTVLLDNQPVENLLIYNEFLLGFSVPSNMSDGFKSILIQTSEGQFTADAFFEVGTPTQPPIVVSIDINDLDDWVFVTGENFIWDQTEINFNGKNLKCFVYSTFSCGFQKDLNEIVTNFTLTTPLGSVNYNQ